MQRLENTECEWAGEVFKSDGERRRGEGEKERDLWWGEKGTNLQKEGEEKLQCAVCVFDSSLHVTNRKLRSKQLSFLSFFSLFFLSTLFLEFVVRKLLVTFYSSNRFYHRLALTVLLLLFRLVWYIATSFIIVVSNSIHKDLAVEVREYESERMWERVKVRVKNSTLDALVLLWPVWLCFAWFYLMKCFVIRTLWLISYTIDNCILLIWWNIILLLVEGGRGRWFDQMESLLQKAEYFILLFHTWNSHSNGKLFH